MIKTMSIEEISARLRCTDMRRVEKGTGLSYALLRQFRSGNKKNPTIKTLMILTDYFKGGENE